MQRTKLTNRAKLLGVVLCLVLLKSYPASAAKNDWAEDTAGQSTGATRDYYNRAGLLAWKNFMGDWRDAKNVEQGDAAYATARVLDDDKGKAVQWDVTSLVRQWQTTREFPNQGFFLRTIGDGGAIVFASREHAQADRRPRLIVRGLQGPVALAAQADTFLTKSTYRSQGGSRELRVSGAPDHALLRFDFTTENVPEQIDSATLRLYTTKQYGSADIGVFRCRQGHELPASQAIPGLASRYPHDQEITQDQAVIFATNFESPTWTEEWTYAGDLKVIQTVSEDEDRQFQPLQGKSLRVRIAKGANGALNTLFKFQREAGEEPQEVYFRYYLRLANDWNQTLQGGKLPGISGTYGVAGWGGRKSNGVNGWSARGSFFSSIPPDNPLGGLHPIGTYCYHADMSGVYGDSWVWQNDYRGFLERNRWYSLEQYLKLNTPGEKDGILRAWVDGRLAFEKTDIRFRLVDRLKIEQIWMNVYHGGTKPSPADQHLFIDNVVVAREYIGPLQQD